MKILVTGAAGYIGSVLVGDLLDEGHQVLALDDLSSKSGSLAGAAASAARFEFVRGDVRDERILRAALKRVDAIVHLAAVVGMPACDREPERARTTNVEAVRLLMRLRSPSQTVVFPNTNSGYGAQALISETRICSEETPLAPISLYGRQKAEAETVVLDGENTVSMRLATVFGFSPRMRRDLLVNDFVWRAMLYRKIEVYEGHAMRNYVHVRDVAAAFREMATGIGGFRGRVYNFGNDDMNLSKLDLAKRIAEHVDGTLVGEIAGLDADQRNYIVSSAKIQKAGIVARIGLNTGIEELLRAYSTLPEFYAGTA